VLVLVLEKVLDVASWSFVFEDEDDDEHEDEILAAKRDSESV